MLEIFTIIIMVRRSERARIIRMIEFEDIRRCGMKKWELMDRGLCEIGSRKNIIGIIKIDGDIHEDRKFLD